MARKGIKSDERKKRLSKLDEAFPFAKVEKYKPLIEQLQLPDLNDRHVLAAAIKANANQIVTNNIKHFPSEYLQTFGLVAKTADDFLADIIDLDPETAVEAFRALVLNRRNPDMDEYQVLDAMRRNNLFDTANYLHALL